MNLFEHDGYYLIGMRGRDLVTWDGVHGSPAGVAKALHLRQRLGLMEDGVEYRMARFTSVPEFTGEVNEEAISSCNEMLDHANPNRKQPSP